MNAPRRHRSERLRLLGLRRVQLHWLQFGTKQIKPKPYLMPKVKAS